MALEETTIIPPNTWYPVNASEPDNSSAPACGTYWGPFWDGTKVFGLNFSSIYYYDFATDKYSYEHLRPCLVPGDMSTIGLQSNVAIISFVCIEV
ncbi:MAG: hypothetical protein IPL97_03090 [Niastella sp.]|nr:hypothetical protein [Niastella sp.]